MPRAICFFCGAMKSSALASCLHCRRFPEADDDLIMSLAMTDRYLNKADMDAATRTIKAGNRPTLDEKTRKELQAHLEEFKRNPVVKW